VNDLAVFVVRRFNDNKRQHGILPSSSCCCIVVVAVVVVVAVAVVVVVVWLVAVAVVVVVVVVVVAAAAAAAAAHGMVQVQAMRHAGSVFADRRGLVTEEDDRSEFDAACIGPSPSVLYCVQIVPVRNEDE
jgi:predicted lysophospholipase L1 biosynthesis ABC-type transport system permease subunit